MATVAHRKAIERELEIINDPLTGEERPRVAELVRQLHAASSVDEFFNLHTKLLARYLVRQRFRDELEADRRAVETRIAALAAQMPKPSTRYAPNRRRSRGSIRAARVQVALAAHTRAIADGLVWKALRYDRAAVSVLADGTRVDRLADDGVGLQPS